MLYLQRISGTFFVVVARIAGRSVIIPWNGQGFYTNFFHATGMITLFTLLLNLLFIWLTAVSYTYFTLGWILSDWILARGVLHAIDKSLIVWNTTADWLYRSSIFTRLRGRLRGYNLYAYSLMRGAHNRNSPVNGFIVNSHVIRT